MLKKLFKIAITGPESTGKSFLTRDLAAHYHSIGVPEYAREFICSLKRKYTANDIERIANEQVRRENELIKYADTYLFCDTDPLVCNIWHKVKFGYESDYISKLYRQTHYDLILLCDIDIEWQFDPLREHPDKREWLMKLYIAELKAAGKTFFTVNGHGEERIQKTILFINKYFNL